MTKRKFGTIDLDNIEFQQVKQLVDSTNHSIFLTGKAGTGKSTFMRFIKENCKKKSIVLAPTGIAAINANGVTIHSFFHLPLKPILPDDPTFAVRNLRQRMKYSKSLIKLIKSLELIIIDEISMVRADTIDFIDRLLRVYSENMREPFGGKQLLLVGDIFQLEPVATPDVREILRHYYPNLFFFSAKVFTSFGLVPIELKKCYRQNDSEFIAMLDRIRIGKPLRSDLEMLNSRFEPGAVSGQKDFVMTLATRREMVNSINESQLELLKFPEVAYEGEIEGDFPESALPAPLKLSLKIGAQVVFIRNDFNHRWYNGTIGKVHTALPDKLVVELEDGSRHTVDAERWSNIRYEFDEVDRKINEIELGAFLQYPLRLAWAITVHKSQGLTFNNVIIDMGSGAFTSGQTYVALSRCRSLDGLTLRSKLTDRDIFVNHAVADFSLNFNNPEILEKAFRLACADKAFADASELWTQRKFPEAFDKFIEGNNEKNVINQKLIVRLLKRKLSVFSEMKSELDKLKETISRQNQLLESLAGEYVSMGYMALEDSTDLQPAIANFEKAIHISPHNPDAFRGKAIALAEMGETDAAIETYRSLLRNFPDDFLANFALAELFEASGEIHSALDHYMIASRIEPQNPRPIENQANIYENIGDDVEAKRLRSIAARMRKRKK